MIGMAARCWYAGCGQREAESIEGSAGNVAEMVEEIRVMVAEVDALADELAEMGTLGLADPQLGYDKATRKGTGPIVPGL